MLEAGYEPLSVRYPEWGRVAVLPWDAEIFGFPVADYERGDLGRIIPARGPFLAAFNEWTAAQGIELVSCSAPADDPLWIALMPTLGFTFIDCALRISIPRLQALDLPAIRTPIRLAEPDDRADVERIAESAFRFGRYHADPRFPRNLANRRYRRWLGNEFASLGDENRMYVAGEIGRVRGFFHVRLRDDVGYITIQAVDPKFQRGITGFDVIVGALNDLKRVGVRRVTSKISAANIGIVNLTAFIGFRYSDPEAIFHWHAPDSTRLVDMP